MARRQGGSTASQTGEPAREYDTTGTSPRVAECNAAQAGIDTGASALDALPMTESRGDVLVKGGESLTIVATNPGGLNVVDFTKLRAGNHSTITLNGGGAPGTTFVLRGGRKLDVRFQGRIVLEGGASAERVIFYGRGKCKMGAEVIGSGTLICPSGTLLLGERVEWDGAVLGGRKIVQLRDNALLVHVPLQVGS